MVLTLTYRSLEPSLELYFRDSANFLLIFSDRRKRDTTHTRVTMRTSARDVVAAKSVALGDFFLSKVGNKIAGVITGSGMKLPELEEATQQWCARKISNFAYLVILNQVAGRTPNGASAEAASRRRSR